MDSQIVIPEEQLPLLNSLSPPASSSSAAAPPAGDGEILPDLHSSPPPTPLPSITHTSKPYDQNQRLASLDVFRGLTVALMILVDDAGGDFPAINHAPWFGVTIADFVMPFFLFGVGVSIALVCRKSTNKLAATRKIIMRTIKLFLLGVLLQGGYFHGRNHWTYGVDIDHIRWLGVLQRISIGYFLGAMSEIWLTSNLAVDSPMSFMKKYYIQCSVMAAVTCFVGLQFGHVIIHIKSHMKRTLLWSMSSLGLLLFACIVAILGTPFSKPLYTLSYMFLTAGASGIALSFIYYLVDVKHIRKPSLLLQWMGMNALLVYVLAACELFPAALQGFYWRSPSNNLVKLTESFLQTLFHSKKWGTLAFVILEIIFWCIVSGFLHLKGIYFKL